MFESHGANSTWSKDGSVFKSKEIKDRCSIEVLNLTIILKGDQFATAALHEALGISLQIE